MGARKQSLDGRVVAVVCAPAPKSRNVMFVDVVARGSRRFVNRRREAKKQGWLVG